MFDAISSNPRRCLCRVFARGSLKASWRALSRGSQVWPDGPFLKPGVSVATQLGRHYWVLAEAGTSERISSSKAAHHKTKVSPSGEILCQPLRSLVVSLEPEPRFEPDGKLWTGVGWAGSRATDLSPDASSQNTARWAFSFRKGSRKTEERRDTLGLNPKPLHP